MQARTVARRSRSISAWPPAAVAAVVLMLLALLIGSPLSRDNAAPQAVVNTGPRIAYFEFGLAADTLWLADPYQPARREPALQVRHARQFGAVPSMSPDGRLLAYSVLPPDAAGDRPDAGAGIWVTSLTGDASPRLVARQADLLVKPVWTPGGESIVFRRTAADGYSLLAASTNGGAERLLAQSKDALFPVGFAPDGSLAFVSLNDEGSFLYSVDGSGATSFVEKLSDGLTRDWTLSPDGSRVAFLAVDFGQTALSSKAWLLDLTTLAVTPLTDGTADAFSPVWSEGGQLVVGNVDSQQGAHLSIHGTGAAPAPPPPARGFEAPVAVAPAGAGYVVRAFSGASAGDPGPSSLTFVGADGVRRTIASGEVTFAGWRP